MLTKVSIGLFFPEPVTPGLSRGHRFLTRTAFYKYVCFEGHFARKQNHFVPLFALQNALSPQRNTKGIQVMGRLLQERFEAGTAKALRLLVAAAFANRGYHIKLRENV